MHAFDLTPDPALACKPVSRFLTRIRLVADRKYLRGSMLFSGGRLAMMPWTTGISTLKVFLSSILD
jgi:hypothetical protein